MSGNKLNQSLDDILTERRSSGRTRGTRPVARRARQAKTTAAPVGGVQKATKAAKTADKTVTPAGPSRAGEGKIIVSNLPQDVSESQIKDYFHTTVGPVKKVFLTYGPNGQSRGIATVTFVKHDSAAKAAKELDGLKVDKRPMKIELILSAKAAPEPIPVKSLSERVGKPKPATKDKAKPATAAKPARAGATASTSGARGGRGKARGRNAGRGKPKTAEELDAEMQDYFTGDAPTTANGDTAMATNGGAVQPVANGDAGMEDEIM